MSNKTLRREWRCPKHLEDTPKFNGGRLWCLHCKRELPDAVEVMGNVPKPL